MIIRLRKSIELMLSFYMLQCHKRGNGHIEVTKFDEYREQNAIKFNRCNHNYLCTTIIISSN